MRRSVRYLVLGIVVFGIGTAAALFVAFRTTPGPQLRRSPNDEPPPNVSRGTTERQELTIRYPLDDTLFPPESVPPTFRWEDSSGDSDTWRVTIEFEGETEKSSFVSGKTEWMPSEEQWESIKRRSLEKRARVTVVGASAAAPEKVLSAGSVSIRASQDPVGAPIFYREVVLPFIDAFADPPRIRWRFGVVSSREQPPIVLENLPVCGNCHSFSSAGTILGMDVDYANDKGSYVITPVAEEMTLDEDKIITWADYKREDNELTFGLLSQVSPDGRYVVSTVKDRSVFVATEGLTFSQLFFPVKGILVVYDRKTEQFHALPGADDEQFVQSNPSWSPDGKRIVFARAKALQLKNVQHKEKVLLTREECREFLEEGRTFLFDLYRIPFNDGRGGKAEPLEGASHNGMSNYFAKYSPDGKWIVFCKARSFMLLQPDSELYIVPSEGGEARRMRCNTPRMNSWHSWSPNGKWLVFSSKANTPYTQLFLTHVDEEGCSSPAVLLERFTAADRAANIPEFVNAGPNVIKKIHEQFVNDYSYARAGDAFRFLGDHQRAVRSYRQALKADPSNPGYHINLGIILAERGMYEEAKIHFTKVIEGDPEHRDAHNNLGSTLYRLGKLDEAIAHYREAVRIDPQFFDAQLSLGAVLLEVGELEEAADHLSAAVQLSPTNLFARYQLGIVFYKQGKLDEAANQYGLVLERDPNCIPAILGLATIRARAEDPELRDDQEAVRLAAQACELTKYQDPMVLDAQAGVFAAVGRFTDAASAVQRALRIARSSGNEELVDSLQRSLELYQKHEAPPGPQPP